MNFSNIENFNPGTCIGGKVMRISRVTAGVFRKYLQPLNITDSQISILFILTKKGGLTQKQICDILKLEKSSLNRNLKRLFERNYLSKTDFPVIRISNEGKKFVETAIPEWEKAMNEIRQLLKEDGENAIDLIHEKLVNK